MITTNVIATSVEVALQAHDGQVDKAGKPYIHHPLRLMAKMDDEISKAVAVLHDVIEDSDFTANDLIARGIPFDVVTRVEALSRRDGESYMQFIDRIAPDEITRKVKIADLKDNMDLSRLPEVTDVDTKRNARYQKALLRLERFDEQLSPSGSR